MPEQQNIEYKQSWHDDYLKWVCGFTNAQGGVIFIGKDDNGNIVGVADYKKLMDDIPNKIRNTMGITAEVNLHEEEGKYFIEIVTHPYSVPISVRGRYYYRSGSTKQELTGAALNEFLLKKSGKTWDDVIEARATFADIDEKTIKIFLAASQNTGRLPENDGLDLPELFEKLRLTENGQLKRAAIILFGKDPGKFYPSIYVKIGRFGKDDTDIIFQETEEGNLIMLLQAVLNQLNHKFLIRSIGFEGMHRIEKGEYPLAAIREMLLNALVHRNYMGAPIQIRVYDDKISIWNEGSLPAGLTLAALKRSHSSRPRNPIIADVAFKGGYIDAWGRGTIKILDTCKEAELPEPEMQEQDGGFSITLFKNNLTQEHLTKLGLNDRQVKAIIFVKEKGKISNADYQELFSVSKATATRDLTELLDKFALLEKVGQTGAGTTYILKI
ncbi:MAG: putative DNA binding domain-containing protein [Chitinophagaceae bacterium]|nr:putative DNA binding domain-containing protein [Chitinophagaceae bacterium]